MKIQDQVITLDKINLQDLRDNPKDSGQKLLEVFKEKRACAFFVTGYSKLQEQALIASKSFFSQSTSLKESCHGTQQFSKTAPHPEPIKCLYNTKVYEKPWAEVAGRERGWVPAKTSNTKVNKEYFQYGLSSELYAADTTSYIKNLWPDSIELKNFKQAKNQILDEFVKIHHTIWDAMGAAIYDDNQTSLYKFPSNIIVRDTHYLPITTKTDKIRNKAHVDLSEGTLVSYAPGLQIYIGHETDKTQIESDESNWYSIDSKDLCADCLIYLPSLALEIRTGGAIKAVWHRVIGTDQTNLGTSRYSIVSFGNAGTYDTLAYNIKIPNFKPHIEYPAIRRDLLPLVGNWDYNYFQNQPTTI